MECNKDDAVTALQLAEKKMQNNDFTGALKTAKTAQRLFPELDNISQLLTVCEVHCSAQNKIGGSEMDLYGILQVEQTVDVVTIKKQYRKLALLLNPDQNKFAGAEAAFKLIGEANRVLTDQVKRSLYETKCRTVVRTAAPNSSLHQSNGNISIQKHDGAAKNHQNIPRSNYTGRQQYQQAQVDTFWTCCPFCKVRYQYYKAFQDRLLNCQNCSKNFVALNMGTQVMPPRSDQSQFANLKEAQNQGSSKLSSQNNYGNPSGIKFASSHPVSKAGSAAELRGDSKMEEKDKRHVDVGVGKKGVEMPKSDSVKSKEKEPGTLKNANRKGRGKSVTESSESCGTGDINNTGDVSQENVVDPSILTGGNQPRKSSRQMQNISYRENFSDDANDFVSPPKKPRENNSSSASEKNMKNASVNDGVRKDKESAALDGHEKEVKQNPVPLEEILPGKRSTTCESEVEGKEAAISDHLDQKYSAYDGPEVVSNAVSNPEIIICPDPEFNDFDKGEQCFAVNQIWAIYDTVDAMPRFYARIRKVFSPGFKLQISWLKPDPDDQGEIDWCSKAFPVGCGKYTIGHTKKTADRLIFSHQMFWINGRSRGAYMIYPRKGETWALFQNWGINWFSDPEKHIPYQLECVEILSDFDKDSGIVVAYLCKVKGFVSLFQRSEQHGIVSFKVPPGQLYRFSHRIPSFRMTGEEREGVPKGCFEFDPASLPENFFKLEEKSDVKKDNGSMNTETSGFCPNSLESEEKPVMGSERIPAAKKHEKTDFKRETPIHHLFVMEKIASDLKITELKQSSLCKAYEELHSQASSVLLLTLQWKDLQEHFDSTRSALQGLLGEVRERDKEIDVKEKQWEAKQSRLNSEFDVKVKKLEEVDRLIETRSRELDLHEKRIESVKLLIQKNCKELEVKEKQFAHVNALVKEKERERDYIHRVNEDRKNRLDSAMKNIKEAESKYESKVKDVDEVRATLKKYIKDIELKERQFNAIGRLVEERREEVELKEGQLRVYESAIDEWEREIQVREEKLSFIKNSIVECSNEVESKERQLGLLQKEVELKEKQFALLRKSMDECCHNFETKQKEWDAKVKELELKERVFESKFAEIDAISDKMNECLREVELKEKNIDSLSNVLGVKEREFESRVKEFEMKKKEFESNRNSELGVKEKGNGDLDPKVKVEESENSITNNAVERPRDGRSLQLLLNKHLKRHDLICSEINAVLVDSSDPAKLVLDAMEGFCPSNLSLSSTSSKDKDFDLIIIRRSCVILLEQLMAVSPQINPQVRREAIKLASDWKAQMKVTADNDLVVLGFLNLLASFRLGSHFVADEIRRLIDIVSHHRQAPGLRQALCVADKAAATVKIEPAEDLPANPSFLVNTGTSGGNLLHLLNELLSGNDMTRNKIVPLLKMSTDPAKLVLDVMEEGFLHYWMRGNKDFKANVMKAYIFIFEQLMKLSPQFVPRANEDVMKLAFEWKVKIRAISVNSFEMLCFLQFLAAYGLVSSFSEDAILMFLDKISEHKEALELFPTLGFAKKAPELVRTLIARKQYIKAVRLICSLKLADEISPIPLLKEYLEDAKNSTGKCGKRKKPIEVKEQATEEELAALRYVKQCIVEYSLESGFPTNNIDERIALLEKIQMDRKSRSPSHAPKVDQQQQQTGKKKFTTKTFNRNEPPVRQRNNKCPRIAEPVMSCRPRISEHVFGDRLREPQVFSPITLPHLSSSSSWHETALPTTNSRWPYGFVGSENSFGPNLGALQNAGWNYTYDTLPKYH